MNEQIRAAIDAFNRDNTRTEKADTAINTLISCFGDTDVDVIHCRLKPNEVSEMYLQSYLTGTPDEQVERLLNHFRNVWAYWSIIIKFPHETITNEFGKKVDIYDFFVKVNIRYNGTYHGMSAIKSTYTEDQFYSGYVHSHCPSVRQDESGIKEWRSMCFGSGPINSTMRILSDPNHDSRVWVALASELRQWVRTESTDGGPYFRMEHISNKYERVLSAQPSRPNTATKTWLKPLIKSYLRAERLKVGYIGKQYCLGTTFAEWLIDFSKYALAWGEKNGVTIPTVDTLIINNKICVVSGNQNSRDRYAHLIGSQVLTFKGEAVNLKIIQGEKVEHMNLISYPLGLYIIKNILNIINYNYGRTEANRVTSVQWG